ncbi:uncharacterized protein ACIBXB_016038 [Morphnus guianensis]
MARLPGIIFSTRHRLPKYERKQERSSPLWDPPETPPRRLPESFSLCFTYLTPQVAAPDSSKEATQDDFSPLQEALSSRIDPRLLPGISQSVLTSAFGTGDPSYLPQTPPRSSPLWDPPETPPRRLPESFSLCFTYLTPQVAAPDSSKEATQDDFSPLQEALSSRIDPRLLPGISQSVLTSAFGTGDPSYLPQTPPRSSPLWDPPETPPRRLPESFSLCFTYLTPQVAAPDSSKEATQDDFSPLQEALSSRIDPRLLPGISQSVLTSAFGTGDPSYLPQTPPRSSPLWDPPETPPRRLPESFSLCFTYLTPQVAAPDSSKEATQDDFSPLQEALSSRIDPRLLPGISQSVLTSAFGTGDPSYLPQTPPRSSPLWDPPETPPRRLPESFSLCFTYLTPQVAAPDSSKEATQDDFSPLQEALSSRIDPRLLPGISQSVLTSAFGTGDPSYLPQTPPRSSPLWDPPETPPRRLPESFSLCFTYLTPQVAAPDSSKEATQDDFSPLQEALSSRIDPRLLPGISQSVLTSAFGTGDPSYLPQTPPSWSRLPGDARALFSLNLEPSRGFREWPNARGLIDLGGKNPSRAFGPPAGAPRHWDPGNISASHFLRLLPLVLQGVRTASSAGLLKKAFPWSCHSYPSKKA